MGRLSVPGVTSGIPPGRTLTGAGKVRADP